MTDPFLKQNEMNPPKLFALTQPSKSYIDSLLIESVDSDIEAPLSMTPEESIVFMARVSSPNQRTDNAERLLSYLVKRGHWSPFDMVDMTIEIHTSRAIMAQILRHWSFRFQEFSQRYSAVPEGQDWSHVEARQKGDTNRQGSLGKIEYFTELMKEDCIEMEQNYQTYISKNIAPESARMIMPLATPTRAYMKGSVRSWMTYFWQRCDKHAQKEHRLLAEQMFEIFSQEFPVISSLVKSHKPMVIEH